MPMRRIDQAALARRYRRNRARSRALFDMLSEDAYYERPIALRHPIVFYEGHLPGFGFNTLVKKALGQPAIDPALERLFARGIDPRESAGGRPDRESWPSREAVQAFAAEADRRILDALDHEDLDRPGDPLLDRAGAVHAILEHEEMHQETLLYMWHRLAYDAKRAPDGYQPLTADAPPVAAWVEVPAGAATIGVAPEAIEFGWDNEFPSHREAVPAFAIERHDVTNARYLEFVEAGGYRDPRWWRDEDWAWIQRDAITHPLFWEQDAGRWYWRGLFARIPLPHAWPVYVSQAEASAFAAWAGARLPTEAEFQRAAYGSADAAERTAPAGAIDFVSWDPQPAGSHPESASAWGVEDLIGNGWEWTSTPFGPFPGFTPSPSYPEYSADFFDGEHFVMKGASTVTAVELVRPTFRNWFRARYPYVYATFRCARNAPAGA
jgi:iron(II)-dependent oxidoreductase